MPILGGIMEEIGQPFYSTCKFAKGDIFSQWTCDAIKLYPPCRFIARRLWVELVKCCDQDKKALKAECSFVFTINGKVFFRGPASHLVLEHSLQRIIDIAKKKKLKSRELREAINTLQFGWLLQPIVVESNCLSLIRFDRSSPLSFSADFEARIFLDGTLRRPVN